MSEVKALFGVPVCKTYLPEKFSKVIQTFDKYESDDRADIQNYGHRSKNSYILDEPQCQPLSNYILEKVREYSYNNLWYDYSSYRMSQSWLSYKEPGQHHTMHTHPNSLISGVFYFGPSEEKTPAIRFHSATVGVNAQTIKPKMRTGFKPDVVDVMFEAGMMILFPSYLHHSVPVNTSNSIRCSLAFNVVPTIGFGDEGNLTELKF